MLCDVAQPACHGVWLPVTEGLRAYGGRGNLHGTKRSPHRGLSMPVRYALEWEGRAKGFL